MSRRRKQQDQTRINTEDSEQGREKIKNKKVKSKEIEEPCRMHVRENWEEKQRSREYKLTLE